MVTASAPNLGLYGLRSMVCALLIAACSPQGATAPRNETLESEIGTDNELQPMGEIRQSPERVRELTAMAKSGDVSAMHGLASHHITASELKAGRYWLGEAVQHGDCHAVQIFENWYLKVPPQELAHWREEGRKLGCDPKKDYSKEAEKQPGNLVERLRRRQGSE